MTDKDVKNKDEVYMSFNHNYSHCCFGTSVGFYIYQINPFTKVLSRKIEGGVSLVKMLHESNIIIFVGSKDTGKYPNNKLIIWDDQKKSVLGEISYNSKVINAFITKKHIVTLCEKKIYIYNFESLTLVKSINIDSTLGIMSIGLEESDFLIYPGSDIGTISIIKMNLDYCDTIKAHTHPIENLHLSNDGKYFVTASEKGTIIRIFSVENSNCIHEVRRGIDPSKIVDLKLSKDNSVLLVSSVKGTIHLYNTGISKTLTEKNKLFKGYGLKTVANLIPKIVRPGYVDSEWSFSQVYISNISTNSTLDTDKKKIYSFGTDGQFYEIDYNDTKKPKIEKVIRYISEDSDPFSNRNSTIK